MLFVSLFAYRTDKELKEYLFSNVEMFNYNVMGDGQKFYDQLIKNDQITYDNIQKIAIGQQMTMKLIDYLIIFV